MLAPFALTTTRQALLRRVFAAALAAFVGLQPPACPPSASRLTVMVQFEQRFEYDYVVGDGVTTDDDGDPAGLRSSHRTGSVVRYHCYASAVIGRPTARR